MPLWGMESLVGGCFEYLLSDSRFDGIPLILETTDQERWPDEIAALKRFAGQQE